MKNKSSKDTLSNLWFMFSNIFPPIGVYLYFKHKQDAPNKAKRALTGALVGVPVGMMMGYLMNTYIIN